MVPGEVFDIILAFAVRVVCGFANNPYPASPRTIVVSLDVLDPHHD